MSGKTTAGILTLRLCIGGYLIYLAYSLVVPLPTDTKMRVISIVFAVSSAAPTVLCTTRMTPATFWPLLLLRKMPSWS